MTKRRKSKAKKWTRVKGNNKGFKKASPKKQVVVVAPAAPAAAPVVVAPVSRVYRKPSLYKNFAARASARHTVAVPRMGIGPSGRRSEYFLLNYARKAATKENRANLIKLPAGRTNYLYPKVKKYKNRLYNDKAKRYGQYTAFAEKLKPARKEALRLVRESPHQSTKKAALSMLSLGNKVLRDAIKK